MLQMRGCDLLLGSRPSMSDKGSEASDGSSSKRSTEGRVCEQMLLAPVPAAGLALLWPGALACLPVAILAAHTTFPLAYEELGKNSPVLDLLKSIPRRVCSF